MFDKIQLIVDNKPTEQVLSALLGTFVTICRISDQRHQGKKITETNRLTGRPTHRDTKVSI